MEEKKECVIVGIGSPEFEERYMDKAYIHNRIDEESYSLSRNIDRYRRRNRLEKDVNGDWTVNNNTTF